MWYTFCNCILKIFKIFYFSLPNTLSSHCYCFFVWSFSHVDAISLISLLMRSLSIEGKMDHISICPLFEGGTVTHVWLVHLFSSLESFERDTSKGTHPQLSQRWWHLKVSQLHSSNFKIIVSSKYIYIIVFLESKYSSHIL